MQTETIGSTDSVSPAAAPAPLLEGVIVVAELVNGECEEEDEGVPGRYLAHFDTPVPRDQAATIALDAFHNSIAIGTLDDFDISVETEDGEQLGEPEDAASYQSEIGATIERID